MSRARLAVCHVPCAVCRVQSQRRSSSPVAGTYREDGLSQLFFTGPHEVQDTAKLLLSDENWPNFRLLIHFKGVFQLAICILLYFFNNCNTYNHIKKISYDKIFVLTMRKLGDLY